MGRHDIAESGVKTPKIISNHHQVSLTLKYCKKKPKQEKKLN
jgi:hypothetical protein